MLSIRLLPIRLLSIRLLSIRLLSIRLLSIIFLIATAAGAQAQTTVWVTSTGDSGPGSLRQAIADAAPGDPRAARAGTILPHHHAGTFGGSGAERTLTIAPAAGASGTAIITVTVSDGALTTTSTFNVIVMPVYYLAEGATGTFFDLDLLIANPNDAPAPVDIVFLLNGGGTVTHARTIAPTSRVTIAVDDIPGLEAAAVSSVVTSTSGLPLIVERTMRRDATGYGSHTEAATQGAAPVWYVAEGAQGFFSTFILLASPNAEATDAHVTYFREGADPLTRDYSVPIDLQQRERRRVGRGRQRGRDASPIVAGSR